MESFLGLYTTVAQMFFKGSEIHYLCFQIHSVAKKAHTWTELNHVKYDLGLPSSLLVINSFNKTNVHYKTSRQLFSYEQFSRMEMRLHRSHQFLSTTHKGQKIIAISWNVFKDELPITEIFAPLYKPITFNKCGLFALHRSWSATNSPQPTQPCSHHSTQHHRHIHHK